MRSWERYAQNEVQTSNPIKVTVMAYERCILHLNFVKQAYQEGKGEMTEDRIINTEKILNELNLQLNREATSPPEMVALVIDLENLYNWMLNELKIIRELKQTENVDGIISVLQDLLDGYRGVLEKNENQK